MNTTFEAGPPSRSFCRPQPSGRSCWRVGAIVLLTCGLFFQSQVARSEQGVIEMPSSASTALHHALNRLADFTGLQIGAPGKQGIALRLAIDPPASHSVGKQGYMIRSGSTGITVTASDEEGLTNGIYTLLRTLMLEHLTDPFSRSWNVHDKPRFQTRAMIVAPYRLGGSFGFAELSPDMWSFEHWRRYIDWMRLANMTTLTIGSARIYNPDYPNSRRDAWRYDVWKRVMTYCHQIGMKFNWFSAPNLVTQQAFWDNPDKRAYQEPGAWFGNGLDWRSAKDLILSNQKYGLGEFAAMDALELIYSDGGAFNFDDPHPASYIADATRSYRALLRNVGSDAGFVYWNWTLDFWSKVLIPKDILSTHPAYVTLQQDVIPLLPREVTWLDASLLTLIQIHGSSIKRAGNPPLQETVLLGREKGFASVIDFFWYMNPEFSLNMFPHPYLGRTVQEARYAADELRADGAMGYRLAPPARFVNDYAFFRLAWDPTLEPQDLIEEIARLWSAEQREQEAIVEAITQLEAFWRTHELGTLESAEALLRPMADGDHVEPLRYVSNGLTFLTYVVRMAQPDLTDEERNLMFDELYRAIKPMYLFQGLTSDIVWIPEALQLLRARVDMMVRTYNSPFYRYNPHGEIVDRSIYPHATTENFKLRWPESELTGAQSTEGAAWETHRERSEAGDP